MFLLSCVESGRYGFLLLEPFLTRRHSLELVVILGLTSLLAWQWGKANYGATLASPTPVVASPVRAGPATPVPVFYEADGKVCRVEASGRTLSCPGAWPSLSRDRRRVAYFADGQLWVQDASGAPRRLLTDPGLVGGFASWSGDDRWLYFPLDREKGLCIYRIPAGGGEPTFVCKGDSVFCSPAGAHLAVVEGVGLYLTSPDGSERQLIHESGTFPSWAPDGSRLVYSTVEENNLRCYDVAAVRSTKLRAQAISPSWSPDGKYIVFTPISNTDKFCVMRADGSEERVLGTSYGSPHWMGDRIVSVEFTLKGINAWTVKPDGSDRKLLLRHFSREIPTLATEPR